jgi:hypothetical protein
MTLGEMRMEPPGAASHLTVNFCQNPLSIPLLDNIFSSPMRHITFDPARVVMYRHQGLTWDEIGDLVGVRGDSIAKFFKKHPELLHQAYRLPTRSRFRRAKRRCYACSQIVRGIYCSRCNLTLVVERPE